MTPEPPTPDPSRMTNKEAYATINRDSDTHLALLRDNAIKSLNELSVFFSNRKDPKQFLVNQALQKIWETE